MLFGPDGRLLPDRKLAMTAAHIRALGGDDDATYLLKHGAELLPQIRLELVCLTCLVRGLAARVELTPREGHTDFRCGHTSGYVRTDRGVVNFSKLLDELRWNLRCQACASLAVADNSKADATFQVSCACTTRELANPMFKSGPETLRRIQVG